MRECLNIDNRLFSIGLLDLLLFIENVDNLCVVVAILLRPLPIVKVDQHVRQKLVQSIFHGVCCLLGLCPLLRLLRLLVLLRLLRVVGLLMGWLLMVAWLLVGLLGLVGVVSILGGSVVARILLGVLLVLSLVALIGVMLLGIVVLLLGSFRCLLVALGLRARLCLLALECPLCLTRLTILCLRGLSLASPLMLIFNLIAQLILMAFLRPIDAFFLGVFVFALFLSFLFICIDAHVLVLYGLWLAWLPTAGCLLGSSSLLLLLLALSLLLLRCLSFFLIDQVMHGHDWLLTVGFRSLMVLAFVVGSSHSLIRLVPSALLLRTSCGLRLLWMVCHDFVAGLLVSCGESLSGSLGSCGTLLVLAFELLLLMLLPRRPHMDNFYGLTDIELRLHHHGVIALL